MLALSPSSCILLHRSALALCRLPTDGHFDCCLPQAAFAALRAAVLAGDAARIRELLSAGDASARPNLDALHEVCPSRFPS